MKKVVVVTNKMVIGGIEKGLLELINFLVIKYDVTLILGSLGGELYSCIPKNVKIKLMSDNIKKIYYLELKIFFF